MESLSNPLWLCHLWEISVKSLPTLPIHCLPQISSQYQGSWVVASLPYSLTTKITVYTIMLQIKWASSRRAARLLVFMPCSNQVEPLCQQNPCGGMRVVPGQNNKILHCPYLKFSSSTNTFSLYYAFPIISRVPSGYFWKFYPVL